MSISVVLPVYNQVHFTERCLQSVLENTSLARELIVVDNGSRDTTPTVLRDFEKKFIDKGWQVKIITIVDNIGPGKAVNMGVKAANGSFLGMLTNDIWLMPRLDEILLHRLEELSADMIGPYYDEGEPFDPITTPAKATKYVSRNKGKYSRDFVAVMMFMPRETIDEIGLFDERFFLTYEDTDLRERMDRAGKRYYQVGDCYIWHFSKGTRSDANQPSDYEKEGLRLFMEKWGFDPREREKTLSARYYRKWKKLKSKFGLF